MSYCLFFVGNGRLSYLERSIASWEVNLTKPPAQKIIFDDSGNEEYVNILKEKFGNTFEIVPVDVHNVGHSKTINFIFDYLSTTKHNYFLQVEEDWMLNRELNPIKILNVLKARNDIWQIRLPRSVWHEPGRHTLDLEYGTLLNYYTKIGEHKKYEEWYEFNTDSYFWSHNPSFFSKKVLGVDYPDIGIESEYEFGLTLKKIDCSSSFGYWGKNPFDNYVSHIGYHDKFLISGLPQLDNFIDS